MKTAADGAMLIVALDAYQVWSLALTAAYDVLTLLLLCTVVYETFIVPRLPNVALNLVQRPKDTKMWSWEAATLDFLLENRGRTPLTNMSITSDPDDLRWGALNRNEGKPTSTYFAMGIPRLDVNEQHQLFWCEGQSNADLLNTPFTMTLEFDNPVFRRPKRLRRKFTFDLRVWKDVLHGVNTRYDVHNVASELARIREALEKQKQGQR